MSDSGQILRRSIGIVFADGGLLALTAARPPAPREHGEEEVAAVLCDPDGAPVELRRGAALDRVRRRTACSAGRRWSSGPTPRTASRCAAPAR